MVLSWREKHENCPSAGFTKLYCFEALFSVLLLQTWKLTNPSFLRKSSQCPWLKASQTLSWGSSSIFLLQPSHCCIASCLPVEGLQPEVVGLALYFLKNSSRTQNPWLWNFPASTSTNQLFNLSTLNYENWLKNANISRIFLPSTHEL